MPVLVKTASNGPVNFVSRSRGRNRRPGSCSCAPDSRLRACWVTHPPLGWAEIKTLAETIDTWWPEIEAFLRLNITNARTEGSNRTIKQLKRVGCGFANQANYERRILAYATARDAA